MPYAATTSSRVALDVCRSAWMVGSVTLTMKKSMIGSAAPSSTVTSPAGVRAGLAGALAAAPGAVVWVAMATTVA
jgi:hypothetical protein